MNRTARVAARRAAVAIGVAGSVGLGAASIRAASEWTAAAPQPAPVTAESLASQLAAEQQREADLQNRLDAALEQAARLQTALDAAEKQVGADAGTVARLQARIEGARARLALLEKQASSAASVLAARSAAAVGPAAARPAAHAKTGASGAGTAGEPGEAGEGPEGADD